VPVVMLTHRAREAAVQQALRRITALDVIAEPPMLIRIEDENGGAYDGPPPGADRAAREGMPPRAAPRTTGDRP